MPAGFQVFTHAGNVLQIDSDSIVYSLRKSGQVNCDISAVQIDSEGVGLVDITGYSNPLVAVQSHIATSVELVKPTGGYLPYYGSSGRTYAKFTTGVQNSLIQYYIFDQWTAPGGNVGIEVFDAAGNTAFHSDWHLMDVVDFLGIPAGAPLYQDVHNAGYVGGNRALAKTLNRVWTIGGGNYPGTYKDAVRIANGNAEVSYVIAGGYGNSQGWNSQQTQENRIIVVDTGRLPANYG